MEAAAASPILILGMPRSGSTWIGQILGETAGAYYVHEPDNETNHPFALRAKAGLGRFPYLRPGERAPRYEACWEGAFAGGRWTRRTSRMHRELGRVPFSEIEAWCDPRRASPLRLRLIGALATPGRAATLRERPVAKSVHGLLAAEWILRRWRVDPVVVRRHPLNVVASWRWASTGTPDDSALEYSYGALDAFVPPRALAELAPDEAGKPPPDDDRLGALAWFVGFLATARERLVSACDGVVCVDHDRVCRAPADELRALASRLGLDWTLECDRALARHERPGTGFNTHRIATEQPERWRTRLSDAETARVAEVLERFPAGPWFGSPAP